MLGELLSEKVFAYFQEISEIPRGSRHNEKIGAYLLDFAKKRGLSCAMDSMGNVVIRKPGTKGYEDSEIVIIQGHMDMVCEVADGYEHDFQTEGLQLCVEDDYIYAEGTSLGADDGVAIAYGLAILDSEEYEHPPLELLVTVDEEIGMLGAAGLDFSMVKGKRIINVDSEEEGTILTSCAGGMTAHVTFPVEMQETTGTKIDVLVKGLLGGHSGIDVVNNRRNGANVLARVLGTISSKYDLIALEGGIADNSITRMATAQIVTKNAEDFVMQWNDVTNMIQAELRATDPDVTFDCVIDKEGSYQVMSQELAEHVVKFINLAPFGIQWMSGEIDGLPESSLNMGILTASQDKIEMGFSIRSQKGGYKEYLFNQVKTLAEVLGGCCEKRGEYPAWDYRSDSTLREVAAKIYEEQNGHSPIITGIHAGLECGIFYENIKDADIISIGAETLDIHSPNEKLSISSTRRVFQLVLGILKALK